MPSRVKEFYVHDLNTKRLTLDGTAFTSSAAELNILTGVTATAAELNLNDGVVASATFTIGAETASRTVAIQLKDAAGADMAIRTSLFAYLSDDANGDTVAATAPSGGVAAGTDGVLIPVVAGKAFQLVSEADGDIDVVITEEATDTWYLVLVLPSGKLTASAAIAFTA